MSRSRPVVVVAIKGLGLGGAERLIADSAVLWDWERFDYRVAYALPWKDQLVDPLLVTGVEVRCFGTEHGMTPSSWTGFRRLVDEWDASLVHAHSPAVGALARVVSSTPVVYTEHNLPSAYRPAVRMVNRATYGRNAAVIAVSQAVANAVGHYPGPLVRVVPNGVVVTAVDPDGVRAELGLTPDCALVVHVAAVRPEKGHLILVDAATRLLGMRDDLAIVSIGGEKRPGDVSKLRAEVAARGLADRLLVLGPRPDARRFIAAADVYVNPSHKEGLPVAILEALASARPVVATAVGGVPSVVRNGETGILVDSDDSDALANGVASLLEDRSLREKLGRNGQQLVMKEHGLDSMVRVVESVYAELLDA